MTISEFLNDRQMISVGILGEGWLGAYLMRELSSATILTRGNTAYGVYFSDQKWKGQLTAFLTGLDHLIITIPSGLSRFSAAADTQCYTDRMQLFEQLAQFLVPYRELRVFYTSSISIYGAFEGVVTEASDPEPITQSAQAAFEIERRFTHHLGERFTALRLGGLIGEDRHPIYTLSKKGVVEKAEETVNLIHRKDIVSCLIWMFEHPTEGPVNLVTPAHPKKGNYYAQKAQLYKIPVPKCILAGKPRKVYSIKLPLDQLCKEGI